MNSMKAIMVRVYILESSGLLSLILGYLQSEAKIRGASVFRAITGFGETGVHQGSWKNLLLDLPLVIEFFDVQEKVEIAMEYLSSVIKPMHIVSWELKTNLT